MRKRGGGGGGGWATERKRYLVSKDGWCTVGDAGDGDREEANAEKRLLRRVWQVFHLSLSLYFSFLGFLLLLRQPHLYSLLLKSISRMKLSSRHALNHLLHHCRIIQLLTPFFLQILFVTLKYPTPSLLLQIAF